MRRLIALILISFTMVCMEELKEFCTDSTNPLLPSNKQDGNTNYFDIIGGNLDDRYSMLIFKNLDTYLGEREFAYVNYQLKTDKNVSYLIKISKIERVKDAFFEHMQQRKVKNGGYKEVKFLKYEACLYDKNYIYTLFNKGDKYIPLINTEIITKLRLLPDFKKYVIMSYITILAKILEENDSVHMDLSPESIFISPCFKNLRIGNHEYLVVKSDNLIHKTILKLIKTSFYIERHSYPPFTIERTLDQINEEQKRLKNLREIDDMEVLINLIKSKCVIDEDKVDKDLMIDLRKKKMTRSEVTASMLIDKISKTGLIFNEEVLLSVKDEYVCTDIQKILKNITTSYHNKMWTTFEHLDNILVKNKHYMMNVNKIPPSKNSPGSLWLLETEISAIDSKDKQLI